MNVTDFDVSQAVPSRSPRKVKKILEKDIQRQICDYLAISGYFFWRQNNMPVWDKNRFRALPKYTPKGLPDIIMLSQGMFIGLEVKRPNRNTGDRASKVASTTSTPTQEEMKRKIISNGGYYSIVTSLEDVKEYLAGIKL
jgi:hypothetical protein